jgi:hypothetical protein
MSRRLAVSLLIATLLAPLMEIPAMGVESFAARVTLHPGPPTPVSVEDPAWARGKFPTKFASLETLCFGFTFEGDLLDPGEQLEIRHTGVTFGFGFVNILDSPQSSRTICLQAALGPLHDEIIALYLDGKHSFTIVMASGSVTIASLSVTATGVPL